MGKDGVEKEIRVEVGTGLRVGVRTGLIGGVGTE